MFNGKPSTEFHTQVDALQGFHIDRPCYAFTLESVSPRGLDHVKEEILECHHDEEQVRKDYAKHMEEGGVLYMFKVQEVIHGNVLGYVWVWHRPSDGDLRYFAI